MSKINFGYPEKCSRCHDFSDHRIDLIAAPYHRDGAGPRVMLVGQDPTIFAKPERVRHVLMLDDQKGQLTSWLRNLFGAENYNQLCLYATNVVKCTFDAPPSTKPGGGVTFLKKYFNQCQSYMKQEVLAFRPSVILALGEPAHVLFRNLFDEPVDVPQKMVDAFTGKLWTASIGGFLFQYTPCLHIKTYRVAETYGDKIKKFKSTIFNLSSLTK